MIFHVPKINVLPYGDPLGKTIKRLSISKAINSLAWTFNLELIIKNPFVDVLGDLRSIEITYGGKRVFTGRPEDEETEFSSGGIVQNVSGRSLNGAIIDSSIVDLKEYRNISLYSYAKRLVSKFEGVEVRAFGEDVTKKMFSIKPSPGNSVYEKLEELTRNIGLLIISDEDSSVVITEVAINTSVAINQEIVFQKNLKSIRYKTSSANNFSDYYVKTQKPIDGGKARSGHARDSVIDYYKPLVIVAEKNEKDVQRRAEWEMATRAALSTKMTVTVPGWTQDSGKIWPINEFVILSFPDLSGKYLIESVSFKYSRNEGSVTELTLVSDGAYSPVRRK